MKKPPPYIRETADAIHSVLLYSDCSTATIIAAWRWWTSSLPLRKAYAHRRSIQMLKREWGAESSGKLPHIFNPSRIEAFVPEFEVEDLLWAEVQAWFLRLQWGTCPWTEHSDDDDDDDDDDVALRKGWSPPRKRSRTFNLLYLH